MSWYGRRFEDSTSFMHYNDAKERKDHELAGHPTNYFYGTSQDQGLDVKKVGFYAVENASNHKTDKYEQVTHHKNPVLRRANSFFMVVEAVGRPFDVQKDEVRVIFDVPKGTKVVLPVMDKGSLDGRPDHWDVLIHREAGPNTIFHVQIASIAPVGIWKCKIESVVKSDPCHSKSIHICPRPVYIIFNPYHRADATYYPNTNELEEYVQNDVGKIWKGSYKQFHGRHFIYGQFEDFVLPACCYILDRSGLNAAERGNPIRVARAISAMVNSVDDNGILEGKWSPPYDKGTPPYDWNSSAKIIEEYMSENGQPVKYGQCWVFSAVTISICRALGLPCRSISNFVSAHDTNHSLTIDKYFNEDGDELTAQDDPQYGFDSIWNFHVWNDVWMNRPDLPRGYGGWQAIDSTPQESSDDKYQCGPASVEAVRKGEIGLGYDVPFLFSEVNADICHFVEDKSSPWGFKRAKLNKYHVGKLILTKRIGYLDEEGETDAEDITWQYKNPEGTVEERLSVYNAVRGIEKTKRFYEMPDKESEDVHMELVDLELEKYGSAFKARVVLENRSDKDRTLKAVLSCSSIYYTGVTANPVKKCRGEFVLSPRQKDTLVLTVYPDEYMGRLVDYCMMKIYTMIKVKETNQTWSEEDDFVLEKPKLKLRVANRFQMGRSGQVQITLTNPLEVPLTKCKMTLDGSGAFDEVKNSLADISPKMSITHSIMLKPKKMGGGTLVATFASEEMIDVYGSCKFEVFH
eukprot:maker-scaffold356_size197960-snap-gene-0.33 protein:Tk00537 transcript:maker-scaffold356_size197960-snap-gene-0.33-mRNA-1 annotation:"hypothetical protein TcasGA2_TC013507"